MPAEPRSGTQSWKIKIAHLVWRTVKRHALFLFFLLSFIISWLIWGLGRRTGNDTVLTWLGSFGPAISALVITTVSKPPRSKLRGIVSGKDLIGGCRPQTPAGHSSPQQAGGHPGKSSEGRDGLRRLLSRLFIWRVGLRWFLIALFLVPVVGLTIAIVYLLLNGLTSALPEAEHWHSTLWQQVAVWLAGISLGPVIAPGEELGWRGYALPRLQARVHPLAASVLLGLIWGLWHFDGLIGDAATEYSLVEMLGFIAGTLSASVIYTWLFNKTRGSVLIASIFHAVYDVTVIWVAAILPIPAQDMWIGLVGLAAIALAIILMAGPRLSHPVLRRTEETGHGP